MVQVLQVVESAAITMTLSFVERPEIIQDKHPELYETFKQIYGEV